MAAPPPTTEQIDELKRRVDHRMILESEAAWDASSKVAKEKLEVERLLCEALKKQVLAIDAATANIRPANVENNNNVNNNNNNNNNEVGTAFFRTEDAVEARNEVKTISVYRCRCNHRSRNSCSGEPIHQVYSWQRLERRRSQA